MKAGKGVESGHTTTASVSLKAVAAARLRVVFAVRLFEVQVFEVRVFHGRFGGDALCRVELQHSLPPHNASNSAQHIKQVVGEGREERTLSSSNPTLSNRRHTFLSG